MKLLLSVLAAALALGIPGGARAAAPVLLTVGHADRHPTATWSLPAGVEAKLIEVATSPAAASDGYFLAGNRAAFDLLEPAQTSWTDAFQEDPGTYYVHVGGLDVPCFYASGCPVREFSNVMVLVVDGSGGGQPPPVQPPPAGTNPAPSGLALVGRTASSVQLAWSPPPGGPPVERYVVLRGGAEAGSVPGSTLTYRDGGLAPATSFTYQIVAEAGGMRSVPSNTVVARTLTPSLTTARLAGEFKITFRIVSERGFDEIAKGRRYTETWTFTRLSASRVRVRAETPGGDVRMTLKRSGTSYAGTGKARLWQCFFSPVASTLATQLRITAGGAVGGQWRATRIAGTFRDSAPARTSGIFACPAGSYAASVAGTLVR
jgi:hypothetical protein